MGSFAVLIAACLATALAACDADPERRPTVTPTTPAATSAPATAGCPVPAVGDVPARSILTPGPTDGISLSTAPTERLVIVAMVLDGACRPAAGASFTAWHTDSRGNYGPADGQCCYYRGTVRTDANGRVRLETSRPARYPEPGAPPAHIHLEIEHQAARLETEIVFTAAPRPTVLTRTGGEVPVELRAVTGPQGDSWYGEAVFVLGP